MYNTETTIWFYLLGGAVLIEFLIQYIRWHNSNPKKAKPKKERIQEDTVLSPPFMDIPISKVAAMYYKRDKSYKIAKPEKTQVYRIKPILRPVS